MCVFVRVVAGEQASLGLLVYTHVIACVCVFTSKDASVRVCLCVYVRVCVRALVRAGS